MTTHIALLRAVNLAGRSIIAMAALREVFVDLGFAEVRTLLQSGNVVFGTARRDGLERAIEDALAERFGYPTEVFVRDAAAWRKIMAANPFSAAAEKDPGHLVVMALKDAPRPKAVESLRAAIKGPEQVAPGGRALYVTYPAGIGRSKLTTALIEKTLGTRATGRNWNTVRKLAALAGAG